MRAAAVATLALLLAAACGGAKKDADSPENTEESASSESAEAASSAPGPAADEAPAGKAVAGDDGPKKSTPCGGFDLPDLASVLAQSECEVAGATPGAAQDVKDTLEIKVVPDSPSIAPGATATITVTFKNKGKKDLALDFVVDPEPHFAFELYTLKGARVDRPSGSEPSLPPEVTSAPQPEPKIARIKLAQQGTARLTLKWSAVKYKWASKERAKGAVPGRGYPKDPAGPLPKGKYVLRVVTPLTGVFEGVDHEISQPRIPITIAPMP